MFSRRYNSSTGRGRPRFAGNEPHRQSDRYRSQLVQSIHSSRAIYEAIIENVRRENDMLFALLPLVDHQNAATPTPTASENSHSDVPRSNVSSQSFGTPTGVRRANIQTNPFQGLFMDITNMLVNGVNSPEVNRGLTNEQISVAVQDSSYGNLPADVRQSHTTCPITLDQFEDSMEVGVIRACGHVFRREAIVNWLSTRHTCPTCRRNLNEPVFRGRTGEGARSGGTEADSSANPDNGYPAADQHSSVSSTHPSLGLHFINPTVRQTQGPNQQVNLEFDGIIGVPNSVGDEDAQQQHIASVLEQMFNLPDITGGTLRRAEEPQWRTHHTSFDALGEIARNYESESEPEHEHDDSPEQ